MLRARLFGALSVEVGGTPLPPVPGIKPRSLLAWLLLHPGPHPRARLAGRFWPEVLDTSARASLRSALWAVRGALEQVGGGAWLAGDRATAGIDPGLPRDVDVEAFDRLLASGDPAALRRAVDLARAPLLADLADEWVLDAQDAHRERLIGALLALAGHAEAAGDLAGAVAWTRRALEEDRLREATHRELMRRLAAAGEPAQALAAYRRLAALLAAELGTPPSPATRALADALRTGPRPAPPPPAPAARAAPGPRLVGRAGEWAALAAAWAAAAAGGGGVVLLEGDAGIGKTALACKLASAAGAGGAAVATGAALEVAGGPPLAPWVEAAARLVRGLPAPPADAAWPADLARLVPVAGREWGRAPAPAAPAPDLERGRLFAALGELVEWAAGAAPLLVVLEDMHRADAASLALLAQVGRRLPALRALLVVTRRPAAAADLDAALEGLRGRAALVGELRLGPLGPADLAALVRAAAPGLAPPLAARVVDAAGGNPLVALAAARSAAAGREPAEGVRGAVRATLAALPAPARLLVDLAAALGRPLEPGEALGLVGADDLGPALEAAAGSGLLDAGGDRRVRFAHDLVREACAAEVPAARRAALHGRLAESLARRPDRAAGEVARHLRLSGQEDRAQRYLAVAASEARALGALDDAAGLLEQALALAPAAPGAHAELWMALADVHAWRGDRPAADLAFGRGLALLEDEGDTLALAGAWAQRGAWLHTTLCFPREALEACRRALELADAAERPAPEVRALALAGAAWAEAMAGDPAAVPHLVAAAKRIPEAGADPLLQGELELAQAGALIRAGRFAEAEAPSLRSARLTAGAGRPDLASVALCNVACAAACRGDLEAAHELTGRALALRGQGVSLELDARAARAYILARMGRADEASEAAGEVVRVAARHGVPAHEGVAAFDAGAVLLAAGRPGRAAGHLSLALQRGGREFSRPLARLLLAEALVLDGRPDEARAEVERVPFEPVGPADLPDTLVARMERVQALIAATGGDLEAALAGLAAAERGWRRRLAAAPPGDAFAANVTDLGRPPVAGLVEPGLELARVLADRAALLARMGRAGQAGEAAREAAALAEQMGASPPADRPPALGAGTGS